MLRKVSQYRKSQRDSHTRAQSIQPRVKQDAQEPPKRPSNKLSDIQSQNYKNFLFSDSPPVTSYDNRDEQQLTVDHSDANQDITARQSKTRPTTSNAAKHNKYLTAQLRKQQEAITKHLRHGTPDSGDSKYVYVVKQASRILRNSMVQNYVTQLQTAVQPNQPQQSASMQPFRPVSQSIINKALRTSVSQTERRLKSSARERNPLNSSSVQGRPAAAESARLGLTSNRFCNQTTVVPNISKAEKDFLNIGLVRPYSTNVNIYKNQVQTGPPTEHTSHKVIQPQHSQNIFSGRQQPNAAISEITKASSRVPNTQEGTVKNQTVKDYLDEVQRGLNPQARMVVSQSSPYRDKSQDQSPILSKRQSQHFQVPQVIYQPTAHFESEHYQNLNPANIKVVGLFEIYLPQISPHMSQDDRLMLTYSNHIEKGYLKQAESVIGRISHTCVGYQFNLGLLKLLQGKTQESFQILQENHADSHNFKIVKKQLDDMKVTRGPAKNAVVNQSYFTRSIPLSKQQNQITPMHSHVPVHKPGSKKISEWDLFLFHVKKYNRNEMAKFIEDKQFFDQQLAKMNYICEDTKTLIPEVVTQIIKEPDMDLQDTENIINVTRERNTELTDAPNMAADKALEEVFIELINIQSTYCVGARDPIQESFDELVEGLRFFHEKFDLEVFIADYLEQAAKGKECREAIADLLNRFYDKDKFFLRARTFIMSCFDLEDTEDKRDVTINYLLTVVRKADENRLKRLLDPERFAIENVFNHLIQDIEIASRNEKGPGPLSEDDKHWINRLKFHKEISGRSLDNFLSRLLGVTKQELQKLISTAKFIERPANFERIEAGMCPKPIQAQIQKELLEAWQRHIKKPLCDAELQEVIQNVKDEVKEIEEEVKLKHAQYQERKQEIRETLRELCITGLGHLTYMPKMIKKKPKALKNRFSDGIKSQFSQKFADKKLLQAKGQDQDLISDTSLEEVNEDDPIRFYFAEDRMVVESEEINMGGETAKLWSEHPGALRLRKLLFDIQLMCQDQQVIFNRDKQRLAPLLEKWGIEAEVEKEKFEQAIGAYQDPAIAVKKDRPKIGAAVSQKLLTYLVKNLTEIKFLFQSELEKLDGILVENFRFFSIIDKNVRYALFKTVELIHYEKKGTLIENDVDETDFVYVVLQGLVDYMMFKYETKMTVVAATYRSGEVFGDASIQKQFFDVLKCLSKDRQYLETASDNVYCLKIPKKDFISAIFAEMRVELMFKILLFRKTPYFQELSPYSLIMFASICEVKDYKYGEIILSQGDKPNACFLVAHGCCQSIYQYVEEQSTAISQYARQVLQGNLNSRQFYNGNIDWKAQAGKVGNHPGLDRHTTKGKAKPQIVDQAVSQNENQIKRAYYHGIMSTDEENKKIQYENHIVYGDVKVGEVFGVRTLLDHITCSKYILSNSILFSEQLGMTPEEFYEAYKTQEKEKEGLNRKKTQAITQAVKQLSRFCKDCFEQRKPTCECAMNELDPGVKDKVMRFVKTRDPDEEQDSEKNFTEIMQLSDRSHSVDLDNMQAEIQSEISYKSIGAPKNHGQPEETLDEVCQRKFVDHMHDSLMRSQTSIYVTSATAKLIVIMKEDKTFLNEALKQSIDRVILDQNFKDCDRPLSNFKEVQKSVEKTRGWIQFKKKTETQVLQEAQVARGSRSRR